MIDDGDVAAIFSNGDFDSEAVFVIDDETSLTVPGWFTAPTEQENLMTGQVEAIDAKFDCYTAAAATVTTKMTVTINSVGYIVERKQDLGIGITTMNLKTKRGA